MSAAFLGVLACGCFLLQQLQIPLHLALHQHTLEAGPGHAHGHIEHVEHGHAHAHVHEHHAGGAQERDAEGSPLAETKGEHQPHPAEDHLSPSAGATLPPTLVHTTLAAPARFGLPAVDRGVRMRSYHLDIAPRPPPPGAGVAARAPPVLS